MQSRRGGCVLTRRSHDPARLRGHPARPAALQSSNRAALYFVPPSQGEGTEGGGGCIGRSPARTCAGTFTPTTPTLSCHPSSGRRGVPRLTLGQEGNSFR